MLRNKPVVHCENVFIGLITGQELGKKRSGGRTRLREHWEEGKRGHQPDAEEAGEARAVLEKCTVAWQSISRNYG